ncbi:hypothetical protein PybrP1_008952 [[Pythium] brassicae (nom. inval.)]|nr:hypothetical protein PybrP1_008952 [[Pythium] brassicae (nom. inval.)]
MLCHPEKEFASPDEAKHVLNRFAHKHGRCATGYTGVADASRGLREQPGLLLQDVYNKRQRGTLESLGETRGRAQQAHAPLDRQLRSSDDFPRESRHSTDGLHLQDKCIRNAAFQHRRSLAKEHLFPSGSSLHARQLHGGLCLGSRLAQADTRQICHQHTAGHIRHSRPRSFQCVRGDLSVRRDTKWRGSGLHRAFCDAFVNCTQVPTEAVFDECHRRLHELSSVEAAYVDGEWSNIWRHRFIRCWADRAKHFGHQATSRVDGVPRRSQTLPLLVPGRHALCPHQDGALVETQHPIAQGRFANDQDARVSPRSALHRSDSERARVRAQECKALLRNASTSPYTGVPSNPRGTPCAHKLEALQHEGSALDKLDFHPHWWINSPTAVSVDRPQS